MGPESGTIFLVKKTDKLPGLPEQACMSNNGGIITSGGGFSYFFSQPSYQSAAVTTYLQVQTIYVLFNLLDCPQLATKEPLQS